MSGAGVCACLTPHLLMQGIDNGPNNKIEAIAMALEHYGIDSSNAIYIGDTW